MHQLADKDDTSEDSDYDPSKDTDHKNYAAEDNTDNQQTENTNEEVHDTEVHGDPGVNTDHNPDPDKTSVDEPGVEPGVDYDSDSDLHVNDDDNDDVILNALANLAEDRQQDDGAIKTEDVYYPETQTPSIQRVMGQRLPTRTRSRANRKTNNR